MRKSLILAALLAVFFAPLLTGNPVEAAPGWNKADVKVTAVVVIEDNVWLTFAPSPFNVTCSIKDGSFLLDGSAAGVDKMTTLATQALVNSRNVRVSGTGKCSGGGTDGQPMVNGLVLK
jgi:hypothetical protein